jgi:hypothetical protein
LLEGEIETASFGNLNGCRLGFDSKEIQEEISFFDIMSMVWACSIYGKGEKCIQNVGKRIPERSIPLKRPKYIWKYNITRSSGKN